MPSGKTHDKVTYWTTPLPAIIGWFATHNLLATMILTISYIFAGLMFSGDLDTKSVQYKRWKWFRWIWIPYQKLIKHRSPFSHGLILGTITRLAYLSIWLVLAFLLISKIPPLLAAEEISQQSISLTHQILESIIANPIYFWMTLLGLWLGGMSHTFADESVSFIKKMRKKTKKRSKKRR